MEQIAKLLRQYHAENPFPASPAALYEPCEYILELGGKRLRPAILLLAAQLYQDDPSPALPAAWAVELFHNFSLLHDDIMDAAPLRRGKPTVHTRWNLSTGILSGDAMLIHAYQHLARVGDDATQRRLQTIFSRTAIEVCEGQQMDMDFESADQVAIDTYIRMIELKTAVLLGCALQMGALAAGAPESDAQHLYEFGRLAGIAFQIQDDLLDTYGDPEKFGKQVGGDILQNKKTFLVLTALENASAEDADALQKLLQTDASAGPEKVNAVRAIFDRNQVPERTAAAKQAYETQAFAHLNAVQLPEARKASLKAFVEALFVREH